MLKVSNIQVYNFDGALRGMRNPLNSWDKSDSYWEDNKFIIGKDDLELALKLIKAGSDHSKFLRQVLVSMDISAPRFWWIECDTYRVATVVNSTSTMHTIHKKPFEIQDFSFDNFEEDYDMLYLYIILDELNDLRDKFLSTNEKKYWRKIIELLPQSYNQLRTWTGSYQNLRNMYHSRKNHKLVEWHDFCRVIESLPYSELITTKK